MIDEQLFDTAVDELIETHVRITNLEKITQALADELMAQDDYIDDLVAEYRHALDTLENYEKQSHVDAYKQYFEGTDWWQTQEDNRNAGNP